MNLITFKQLSAAALALGSSSIALAGGSFQEVSEHLDLDGDFIGYMDFDGNGQALGEKLNVIYRDLGPMVPDLPPIPLDFPALFETLGFGSVRSMGMSSTEVEPGLFRNRSVTLLEGDPAGLFKIYGLDPISFRAAEIAPADATSAFSGRVDFNALVETARALAVQIMGPMGEGMLSQGLMQPIPGTDVTAKEAIEALSGGMDLIVSQSFESPQKQQVKAWVSLHGAASLLPRLDPLLAQMGIVFEESEAGRVADLSMFMKGAPVGLFASVPAGSDNLVLYTDADWVKSFGAGDSGLTSTPNFQRVTAKLPKVAAFHAYSSGFDTQQLLGAFSSNPETAAMAPAIVSAIDSLFGGFVSPSASATYREGDALLADSYAGVSYKSFIVALPAGIGAGVAVAGIVENQKKAKRRAEQENESPDSE